MSTRISLKKSLVILFATILCESSSFAQGSDPKTVLDYYLLLPEKYFEANKEQRVKWMLDSNRGAVVDLKNSYIFAPRDGAQTSIYGMTTFPNAR